MADPLEAEPDDMPPWWRLCLALFTAPILPAVIFAAWSSNGSQSEATLFDHFMVVSIIGVYPVVIVCGIPTLLILRRRVKPTLFTVSLSGAFVASLPWWFFAAINIAAGAIDMAIGLTFEAALPASFLGLLGGAIFFMVGIAGTRKGGDAGTEPRRGTKDRLT